MTMTQFTLDELQFATGGDWHRKISPSLIVSGIKTDSREDCRGVLFLALAGEKFDAHNFLTDVVNSGAAALCINQAAIDKINPLWDIPVLVVPDTVTALQHLARHHKRRLNIKTIAVTGSMGKTSVKEIIRSILIASAGIDAVHATIGNTNNQIGVAQNLLMLNSGHLYAVIEMGTNHHGEIEPLSCCAEPDIAVVASIGPCHLEFLGDLNGVAREKSKIFSGLHQDGIAVIPESCPGMDILENAAGKFRQLRFGKSSADVKVDYLGGKLHGSTIKLSIPNHPTAQVIDWKLSGAHQALNAAAAAAAAVALGISIDAIAAGLTSCTLPGMRMKISEINGITWINDAYNANPGSMIAAIAWLAEFAEPEKLVLVLGDMLELGESSAAEHCRVIKTAAYTFPNAVICLIGKQMSTAAKELKSRQDIIVCADSNAAKQQLMPLLKPGTTVFLKGSRGMHLETIEPVL